MLHFFSQVTTDFTLICQKQKSHIKIYTVDYFAHQLVSAYYEVNMIC